MKGRINFKRALKVGDGGAGIALLLVSASTHGVETGPVRLQLDGHVEVRDGALVVAGAPKGKAAFDVQLDVLWCALDGGVQICDGTVVITG